jgi:glycine dehydrogenase subunit 1
MSRYTGVTDEDLRAMLGAIGVDSLEDLFADIPESVRLGREIDLPPGRSEQEV